MSKDIGKCNEETRMFFMDLLHADDEDTVISILESKW